MAPTTRIALPPLSRERALRLLALSVGLSRTVLCSSSKRCIKFKLSLSCSLSMRPEGMHLGAGACWSKCKFSQLQVALARWLALEFPLFAERLLRALVN